MVVRPAMMYSLETVVVTKREDPDLEVAELMMLKFSPSHFNYTF